MSNFSKIFSNGTFVVNLSKSIKLQNTLNYKSFIFPGGEEHIKLLPDVHKLKKVNKFILASSMENSSEIMKMLMATDSLKSLYPNKKIELFSPYYPYARQDRIMMKGEPFSLKVISKIINMQKYDKIHILDPHSDVTPALVDNVNVINNVDFINLVWNDITKNNSFVKNFCIVSPDAGAEKKLQNIVSKLQIESKNIIKASKIRNVTNGNIIKTDFVGDVNGKVCLIYDDIIDGGTTFVELAKKLKEKGALRIYLAVSHGIFSKGLDELKKYCDRIYTTDSFPSPHSDNSKEKLYSNTNHSQKVYPFNLVKQLDFIKIIPIHDFYSLE